MRTFKNLTHTAAGALTLAAVSVAATPLSRDDGGETWALNDPTLASCPGYRAQNVKTWDSGLEATLKLAGKPCNVYGTDYDKLRLTVEYEKENRLHVKLTDADGYAHTVPPEVFLRPQNSNTPSAQAKLTFKHVDEPFSFSVHRGDEVIFDTAGSPLVFEDQYIRLATNLPDNPNIYGLGEHNDPFRLPSSNFSRTLWARDSPGIPMGTNLYGTHPVYYEHRVTAEGPQTHGVFLLNSNGMDVKLNDTNGHTLEYNALGGEFDFYFFAGPSPIEVTKQYAEVAGLPAGVSYWNFGLHQCRWGYRDWIELSEVVANYSAAGIPLETMWADIDYMHDRWIMTLDQERFPTDRMRQLVSNLHDANQHFIVMVDPAVAVQDYPTYNRGVEQDIFLKNADGSVYMGVVWPGPTAWPDWFHPAAEDYWINEFKLFFNPEDGIDIDALWIDMNEPANFQSSPDSDVYEVAEEQQVPPVPPPVRDPPRPIPGFPDTYSDKFKRDSNNSPGNGNGKGPGKNYLYPKYEINNALKSGDPGRMQISNYTARTDIVHYGGEVEYDVHNIYGAMMSTASRNALLARRPNIKPLILTRSTFSGSGKHVGKWLGDNLSTWDQYIQTIRMMLGFASIYQMPMVGADTCGFSHNTTETLCARWATLGAFGPFFRNHNAEGFRPQEFYRWNLTTEAAKNALDIRYRLLDYLYTRFHHSEIDGTPVLEPLFYEYPADENTFGIENQFLFGDRILVSPVVEENSTSVEIYLPDDVFYDFKTYAPVRGAGANITLNDIAFTEIPVHIRGGSILPLRSESAMTTTEVRTKSFTIAVAVGLDGTATGDLVIDDGVSIEQAATTQVNFSYAAKRLDVSGQFDYTAEEARVDTVVFMGVPSAPTEVSVNQQAVDASQIAYDADSQSVVVKGLDIPLTGPFVIIHN